MVSQYSDRFSDMYVFLSLFFLRLLHYVYLFGMRVCPKQICWTNKDNVCGILLPLLSCIV